MKNTQIKISDIRSNRIAPFEIDDKKLIKLFSYFLHIAPTINSSTAMSIDLSKLEGNWNKFIEQVSPKPHLFRSSSYPLENCLKDYDLHSDAIVNRKSKGFICKRKDNKGKEKDCQCFLRHLRNSIAHSNVFMLHRGNRKYLLFEDFNRNNARTSIILCSQTDLQRLKQEIMKQEK